MAKANLQTATNGSVRVPFDQRDGATSDVFFTRDLSPEGLRRAVAKVAPRLSGKIAIKLRTGEKDGPNIIPFGWVKDLVSKDLSDATIVETNTYYEGDRYTTEQHRETIAHNGWTFCPVDIMDEEGVATHPLPAANGLTKCMWALTCLTTTPCSHSPTSRATPWAASADRTKTWALAVPMAALEKAKSTPYLVLTTCGLSPKKS